MVRVSPKRSIRKTFWTLLFGFSTILLFQNCSDLNNRQMPSIDALIQGELQNMPFAFETTIDQMGYMSCSGRFADADGRAFTIKAGAFFPGSGVRIKPSVLSQLSAYNTDIQARALHISERNTETGAVLSIRERNYLQDYQAPQQSERITDAYARLMFFEGKNYFSNEHYVRRMLAMGSGNYMNYISGLPGLVYKNFDGSVKFATNESTAAGIRSLLANSHYITITFPLPVGEQAGGKPHGWVRSPYNTASGDSNALTSVFGRGFDVRFQQYDGRMLSSPARVMTVSNVVNLENQSIVGESWNCNERFVIVRPEDAKRLTFDPTPDDDLTAAEQAENYEVCEVGPDPVPSNNEERMRLDRIRNILPADAWFVTLPRPIVVGGVTYIKPGCVVPKGPDFCYDMQQETGNVQNPNFRIAYYYEEDRSSPRWGHTVTGITYDGRCGLGTLFVCPHYVTICHKN
ncbi:MAG: hypothetical protein M9899_00600 [Bdellovibrionaceae bacterium]|nr:hypothetical protein [Pseudobdellovibrionaceae bacterium]